MDFFTILVFSGALSIFMATPGPGTFAVVARALGSGFRHAFAMSLGIVLGDLLFLLIAILGLSAIIDLIGDIFVIVKYIGGIYLIFLGVKMFLTIPSSKTIKSTKSKSLKKDFISGFIVCIGNPKVILFYLGFLPTFIDLTTLSTRDIVLVSSLVVFILIFVLGAYSYFASKARKIIKKPKLQMIMNKVAGSIMFAVGISLILKQ